MMKRCLLLSVLVGLLLTLSCGGGSSSGGGGSDTLNVSGTWKGTGNAPETGTHPTTLILNQSGNNVSGTWDGLAVNGTVSGNQLNLTLTPFTQDGIYYTGGGSATITGNSMSGTLSMSGKKGTASVTINGTFTATRSSSKAQYIPDSYQAEGFVTSAVKAIVGGGPR